MATNEVDSLREKLEAARAEERELIDAANAKAAENEENVTKARLESELNEVNARVARLKAAAENSGDHVPTVVPNNNQGSAFDDNSYPGFGSNASSDGDE